MKYLEKWTSEDESITLYLGDCKDVLDNYPHRFDSIVTDPPYGLEFMHSIDGVKEIAWDHEVPGPEYWNLFKNVCKPGAFLLSFGGTRTYHRLACAIEDAGWEIRDSIRNFSHSSEKLDNFFDSLDDEQKSAFLEIFCSDLGTSYLYMNGFPKNLSLSKAIDKLLKKQRPVIGENPNHRPGSGTEYEGVYAGSNTGNKYITGPGCDESALWDGWKTALKPAHEPIVVGMNPVKNFAKNALAHGVAGLWIDGCRIGDNAGWKYPKGPKGNGFHGGVGRAPDGSRNQAIAAEKGHYPANVMFSHREECDVTCAEDCSVNELQKMHKKANKFFYIPKPSKKEKGSYNTHPTVKSYGIMEYLVKLSKTPTGGTVLDPFLGSGTTAVACLNTGRRCVGIELRPKYFEIAVRRVKDALERRADRR
jgi:DNA modification methylase